MKKVLIALDFDPSAEKVSEIGFSLAKSMGGMVVLLRVVSDLVHYTSMEFSPTDGQVGSMGRNSLNSNSTEVLIHESLNFLDQTKEKLGDKTIQTLVKEGDFAECILEVAKDMKADLIIMGSHSRKWLQDIVMGSVTEKVLHYTSIPLLIIPIRKTI